MNEALQQQVQEQRLNVAEAWPIYDTMIVCPVLYGAESSNRGWFTNFAQFAANPRHSFFLNRTEATAGLCYCNKQTADTMDFAYELYSVGVSFFAPGVRVLANGDVDNPGDEGAPTVINTHIAHWWETSLPRHCSFELRVQQDTVLELPSLMASPGYGPVGDGASFQHRYPGRSSANGIVNADYLPVMNMGVCQGMPTLKNRFPVTNKQGEPLGIPRTGIVEAIIRVSDHAMAELSNLQFSPYYIFGGDDDATPGEYTQFPARFGIQVSLLGKRLVQQRGNYHV